MAISLSQRITSLPPYLFAELDLLKREVAARGMDVINLGIGDPDLPTPDFVIDRLKTEAAKVENHHYPPYEGMKELRLSIQSWFERRYDVKLDADKEILVLMGSKDGIAHLPYALVDSGDVVLCPDPGYPVYATATRFAGGTPHAMPLKAENDFLPDFAAIPEKIWERTKLLFLNYPNNPTAATVEPKFFDAVGALAKKHDFVVCHDNAYSELCYDGYLSPSLLQSKHGKEVGIEFHSLSKTFNMTGWRVGFAVGNAEMIQALGRLKTHVDSGVFQAVQLAAATALKDGDRFTTQQRQVFCERRDALVNGLKAAGFSLQTPRATFYVWAKVPGGKSSIAFCRQVLQETGVVITPGVGFGAAGEGYFRMTITQPVKRLQEAAKRLAPFAR